MLETLLCVNKNVSIITIKQYEELFEIKQETESLVNSDTSITIAITNDKILNVTLLNE